MTDKEKKEYGVGELQESNEIPAPELPYRPQKTKNYNPNIGLIGCGGITEHHLTAYKNAGYNVVAMCDVVKEKAEKRREQFYPKVKVYSDYRNVLEHTDIEVVDIATHPAERKKILEDAIHAGKHILSQKPFVTDLEYGRKLVDLAKEKNIKLAVNQNGRWAPHFAYSRLAVGEGLIGGVISVHCNVHWDHNWIETTEFNKVKHIVLYDFAIHWFDILTCLMGKREPKKVFASLTRSPGQQAAPALLGQALVEYDNAQATLVFDADTKFGQQDRTYIAGTKGSIISVGKDLMQQAVTLYTQNGHAKPELNGSWFPDGLHGAMAELLCAIEDDRVPVNNAEENLRSLSLCFAAVTSADTGEPRTPGDILQIT